ncbi:glycosyltransferase family 1 protein [Ruminococcus flavefaciens]|uniref:Glycosyl transferase family 1 domain-containing protein n=1 Tax=Ruminococcus flavefaciens 007c TaxID=1341157 RepID=W7UG19_RUMFL|nr:glycosyltransferase family 1 protein [Ruminococcus flavefaciens]EWM54106.1 hypothetical protein RF007C_01150 [Ruminococcus flavefaciens 007c]
MEKDIKPIRVLHVVTHLNRNGLESRIMDIYRNIDRSKVQFDFMIHREELGDFGEEIKQLGGEVYHMPRITPRNFIRYIKELDAFFSKHKEYRIVHAHLNSLCTWVLRSAYKHGVPVRIAHSRNASMEKNLRGIPKMISKLFVNKYATDRFGCSQMAGDWLFGKKYSRGKTFKVIPNAFQVDRFVWDPALRDKKRQELGVSENTVFLDVARLSEQKNHIYLLMVFEEIKKKIPNAILLLAGAGECEEKIRSYINNHNLSDSVSMLGARSDAAELYQAADMFLFPSKYEGFGTVVIEAQMTNLPIIASDTIPSETKLCDCVDFLSIKSSPVCWAKKATEKIKNGVRKDNIQILQKAGFDIRKQYIWMQEFYLKKYKE